ncbi:MAG: transcription-repair coupling factor [Bacteroidales bacterium]|jgi:transcription-repair coupling factor (superfamily II helicase)|nr:transcription-repair coupling factor [Bacteroidales bacterium]
MQKEGLEGRFASQKSQEELVNFIKDKKLKNAVVTGLYGSSGAVAVSCAIKSVGKGVFIIISENREEARYFTNDLYNMLGEDSVFFFPASGEKPGKISSIRDSSRKVQRAATLDAVKEKAAGGFKDPLVVVTYPESIAEKVPGIENINGMVINVFKGKEIKFDQFCEKLENAHFERVDFVGEPGQFALRGGIIDVFSYSDDRPYRIDFFGNIVDSIRYFDIESQHTVSEVEKVEIFPNIFDNNTDDSKVSFFEYAGNNCTVVLDNVSDILGSDFEDQMDEIGNRKKLFLENISVTAYKDFFSSIGNDFIKIRFETSLQPKFNKNFEFLQNDVKEKVDKGYEVFISSDNPKQIERLKSIFSYNEGKSDVSVPRFREIPKSFEGGFVDKSSGICLYTDHQIFDRYQKVKIKREVERSERLTLNELSEYKIGDYVVHINYGVGVFGGLVNTKVNGKIQEAIKLIYKDNDVVLVSIHGIHRISKYKSKDSAPPKIYRLGSGAWQNLKNKTKSKVKDIARDLIKLYAERRASKGFAFSPDNYMLEELESSFIFEDTPDQIKANQAVKEDMEKEYPMDRLICGDVGFGKTEIAIRAAFKAVCDNKQVAVLVPTTILALQHYNTFCSRLKDFPCNIELLSRVRNSSEVKEIFQKLDSGKIDIIIGTHKLLNKAVKFKDLGLLVIDEEQKFGVSAKEKLRHLKNSVDTLTLTATPIPRTLQFSLLGARDLSIINTPPPNRLPVQTEITGFDENNIRDIINFELERGGQVFFVHNKVSDIENIATMLGKICRGAKIVVGHGQMDPKILEKRLLDFISGDYDILVSTSIVENGIDIPNANTIIIDQGQNFGLSDLHQLRGRVGRSNVKAFCYLIVPPVSSLPDDARKRLKAIEAFSDLGSGFNIAMQDLDIRGAGNLLGGEQSGFIADMGFETYQKILSEAFSEIKQEEYGRELGNNDIKQRKADGNRKIFEDSLKEQNRGPFISDCYIDTDFELLIPSSYIPQTAEKIRLYKELDSMENEKDIIKFRDDLSDRFGPLPEQVEQLTYIVRLRHDAVRLGFEKIILKNGIMLDYFVSNQESPYYKSSVFSGILNFVNGHPNDFLVKQQHGKLFLRSENINNVRKAYEIVHSMYNAMNDIKQEIL